MTGEGQQPHHAKLRPYSSVEEALRRKESTPYTRTLDGSRQIRMFEASSMAVSGSKITVKAVVAADDVSDAAFEQTLVYDVDAAGTVRVGHEVVPAGRMRTLPYLPRMGLALRVPERFGRFSWYGRGPQESYNDRKDGTPMGVWRSTVEEEYVPYDRPQSNGNHTDTRWALLTDGMSGCWSRARRRCR